MEYWSIWSKILVLIFNICPRKPVEGDCSYIFNTWKYNLFYNVTLPMNQITSIFLFHTKNRKGKETSYAEWRKWNQMG